MKNVSSQLDLYNPQEMGFPQGKVGKELQIIEIVSQIILSSWYKFHYPR